MRKLILFMHTSLDGFVTDRNGGMEWIYVDEQLFDFAGRMTNEADMAIYGRNTYELMESYWPKAGENPNASKHDIEHSQWYNKVPKVVLSKTLNVENKPDVRVINKKLRSEIRKIKKQPGKNIVIFGSPTAGHSLTRLNLIDEYWLFVNPVILGGGTPVFKKVKDKINLTLTETKVLDSGVIGMHYVVKR